MKKTILIITTRAMTINRFLDQIIKDLSNTYNIKIACRSSFEINISSSVETFEIEFPLTIKSLINPFHILNCIRQIRILAADADGIYLHTPVAAHLARISMFSLKKKAKIIYHVHGLRYISGSRKLVDYLYRVIEYLLSPTTNLYICINKIDYLSLVKFNNVNK